MAAMLSHPNEEKNVGEQLFRYSEGTVLLKSAEGEPLTLAKAIWLLESTKHYIMKLSFGE